MTLRPFLAFLLFATVFPSYAQGSTDAKPLPTPEKVVQILNGAEDGEKKRMAERLLLKEPHWARVATKEGLTCTDYDSVRLDYVVLRTPGPQAVLQVDCTSAHRIVFLVVLENSSQGRWWHLQTFLLWGKYRPSTVDFENLTSTAEKEVVVHGYEVSAGTGWWQYDMLVLKLIGKKLQAIFDEPEIINYSVPTTRNGEAMNTDQHQESQFRIVPRQEQNEGYPAVNDILELQTVRDHDTVLVRCKLHFWVPALRRFQSTATACEGSWFPPSPE